MIEDLNQIEDLKENSNLNDLESSNVNLFLNGKSLNFLRQKYNISQEKLANYLGFSRTKLRNIFNSDYVDFDRAFKTIEYIEKLRNEKFTNDELLGLFRQMEGKLETEENNNKPSEENLSNKPIPKIIKKAIPLSDLPSEYKNYSNRNVNDNLFLMEFQNLKSENQRLINENFDLKIRINQLEFKLELQEQKYKLESENTSALSDGISKLGDVALQILPQIFNKNGLNSMSGQI